MSTLSQIAANRRNSQKSTGPRTDTGKLTSSQNACKTGIHSEAEIILGEDPAELQALATEYHNRFPSAGPEERCLVDILVHSEWLLRRLRRAEAQLWERRIEYSASRLAPPNTDLGGALGYENGEVFSRLQRRIDSTQRNFQRALKDLRLLHSAKPVSDPAPVPRIEPQSATEIGFVPSPIPNPASEPAQASIQSPIGFVPSSVAHPSPTSTCVPSCSSVAPNSTYSRPDDYGVCL